VTKIHSASKHLRDVLPEPLNTLTLFSKECPLVYNSDSCMAFSVCV